MAWEDETTDLIMMRRFNSSGVAISTAITEPDSAGSNPSAVKVTALSTGGFLLTWHDVDQAFPDTSGFAIRAQLFDNAGAEVGSEFSVSSAAGNQDVADVVALDGGGFAVTYRDLNRAAVYGRIYDATGVPLGAEFVVSTTAINSLSRPSIAVLADGRFVVAWAGADTTGHNDIVSQIIDPSDGVVVGSANNETLYGHDLLNDQITGLSGNDTLIGLGGSDYLAGGVGDDTYVFGAGDTIFEANGNGIDTVLSSVSFSLGANLERLTLTGGAAINGTGNTLSNVITGNNAANILSGGSGADTLNGRLGNDTYVLGAESDAITDTGGVDTITTPSNRSLASFGTIDNLVLLAGKNATGNTLANNITGNNAANILNGGAGADTLKGLLGNDTYVLGAGSDAVIDTGGVDTITSTVDRSLANYAAIENLLLLAGTNATGNGLANVVTGNSGNNKLLGMGANDTLLGNGGNDQLLGGRGRDVLTGGLGKDILNGGPGKDTFRFLTTAESGPTTSTSDVILGFAKGADKISLEAIDANAGAAGDQAFVLLAKGTATSAVGKSKIGWFQKDLAGTSNDKTILRLNIDADSAIEATIELKGLINLTAGDFIL